VVVSCVRTSISNRVRQPQQYIVFFAVLLPMFVGGYIHVYPALRVVQHGVWDETTRVEKRMVWKNMTTSVRTRSVASFGRRRTFIVNFEHSYNYI